MPREKPGYRDTIADLNRIFPVQGVLSKAEVANYLGINRATLARWGIQFNEMGRVTKADLARQICLGEK